MYGLGKCVQNYMKNISSIEYIKYLHKRNLKCSFQISNGSCQSFALLHTQSNGQLGDCPSFANRSRRYMVYLEIASKTANLRVGVNMLRLQFIRTIKKLCIAREIKRNIKPVCVSSHHNF